MAENPTLSSELLKRQRGEKLNQPPQQGTLRLRQLMDEPMGVQKIALPKVNPMELEGPNGKLQVIVPNAPQFQPPPFVVGGSDVANAMQTIMRIAPSLQGMINKVQVGPTEDMTERILDTNKRTGKNFTAFDLPNLNLMGTTNLNTRNISLNPAVRGETDYGILPTLTHEATHAAGYGGETQPEEARKVLLEILSHGTR